MRRVQSIILRPLAAIYGLITSLRNLAFDNGWLKSFEFTLPVVVVGNLKVGGTGKTPMVEYITNALKKKEYKVGIISRGYKRKTKGFLLADESSNAKTIGDEPYQYYRKWGNEVAVAVGEDRAYAIPHLLYEKPETNLIVLDDAYQHRRVQPSMLILLTEYSHPFYKDYILPAGLLRESRQYAQRADAIVVTKCPGSVDTIKLQEMTAAIQQYAPDSPVYFTTVNYASLVSFFDGSNTDLAGKTFIVITGIANPKPMIQHLESIGTVAKHLDYPDHHDYKEKDVHKMVSLLKSNKDAILITTEKDAVKLRAFETALGNCDCYYLPIEVKFLDREEEFLDQLQKSVVLSD
ncbi:MAG: tetraacyldisaccharide 4'-kinase [Cyclobacteriaceae bacterium]